MPSLSDVVRLLSENRGRYACLDAFPDDIDELRFGRWPADLWASPGGERPTFNLIVDGRPLQMEVFGEQGVVRFRLSGPGERPPGSGDRVGALAALGGAVGAAIGVATDKKEGLLGGLVFGLLVGGFIGAAAPPVERALAFRFDPTTAQWEVYDGPLLTWAKRTLAPA